MRGSAVSGSSAAAFGGGGGSLPRVLGLDLVEARRQLEPEPGERVAALDRAHVVGGYRGCCACALPTSHLRRNVRCVCWSLGCARRDDDDEAPGQGSAAAAALAAAHSKSKPARGVRFVSLYAKFRRRDTRATTPTRVDRCGCHDGCESFL